MRKYGPEHFWIEEIEKCSREVLSEREVYWTDYYSGYTKGYNGTKGGDGRFYLDHSKILELYDTTQLTSAEIAERCNCERTQVRNIIIAERGETAREVLKERSKARRKQLFCKKVYCEELDRTFESIRATGQYLYDIGKAKTIGSGETCVGRVCNGKRKTTYGMHFKFV